MTALHHALRHDPEWNRQIAADTADEEAQRAELEQAPATPAPKAPRLHPTLAEIYRARAAELTAALDGDDAAEMHDLVRSLVEEIRLVPADGTLRVEVRGELAAILGPAAGGAQHANAESAGGVGPAGALAEQIKMVAGTGNHRQLPLPPVVC